MSNRKELIRETPKAEVYRIVKELETTVNNLARVYTSIKDVNKTADKFLLESYRDLSRAHLNAEYALVILRRK